MNILVIKASANSLFKDYKKASGTPPQSINALAAATPDSHYLTVWDETSMGPADPSVWPDLVAIFMSTPDAYRGYELGDYFRNQGVPVVFGGLHATFVPDETLQHADAIMLGEAENLWPTLLKDFELGYLDKRYESSTPPAMETIKPLPHQTMDLSAYGEFGMVMVSRGCKFKCEYCAVHRFFPTFRYRPVGEVVDEIRNSGLQYLELHADNLMADKDYAMELFQAIKPLGINWMAEATLNFAEHPELLEAAAESGLFSLLVGLETPAQSALDASGKRFMRVDRAKENIARLHEYQIAVDSAMLFGFDQHGPEIFEETLDFVDEIELDTCTSAILTPFPGTLLYERLENEGRLLTKDWSMYDCSHAVFKPALMSAQELEEGADWFHQKYNSLGRSAKRKVTRARNLGLMNSLYF
ncbi:B12-binding domain-containing radical SAM protein [Parendozoicomonas haliclonae]|uniref:Ribosomal protein S12 methylthiotransferase RimO n=1 Tax=Parendozoicomonas haliclonae TaxID=1960125 RepID=A0A1X7AP79_9GAMM|nr:radical SAM protein [Parendozoicomonas haliclonae]SMA49953.1 Ribosomal protein S12 methylthiotransferase RimO [Parendozoicomonas haliclonae]